MVDTFKLTARKWIRLGPLIVCLFVGPVWVTWFSALFTLLQPNSWSQLQNLNFYTFVFKIVEGIQHHIMNSAQDASNAIQHFASDSIVTLLSVSFIVAFLIYFQRILCKPNAVVADVNGLKMVLRIGEVAITRAKIQWSEIINASLYKPGKNAGPGESKIRLTKTNGKKFDLDLAALTPDDRTVLLRRIEKLVPNCQIDYELAQSMLASPIAATPSSGCSH